MNEAHRSIEKGQLHRQGGYLAVHELILGGCPFNPFFRELHWIFGVIDVCQNLHRNHGPNMLRHIVYRSEV
mgnify:CR=1 FL=1